MSMYEVTNLDGKNLPASTTDVGAGIDPLEPKEVPSDKLVPPTELDWSKFNTGTPKYDSFMLTIVEGQVFYLLPEDPNRSRFLVSTDLPLLNGSPIANSVPSTFIGKAGQLVNGFGWAVGQRGNGTEYKTTDAVHVGLKSGTPGAVAQVYVWVEYAV